ncbi:hypothetical protein [Streptomyces sp. DSM 15324]|uniref:hypothetical protein n=1 Tax=Streptomyces sp. DSM 15324 TaxID=1739111 RepID=UPI0007485BF3|nr:hypothetical protein [Streptomyces sp. DSM 15324]KUO10948.1 hypothetical protein AQJ58_18720 [Streptomyces sp. DSM 15324]
MRVRALVVAATGAVALTALAVPAAQAAPAPPAGPAVTFSNVKINGGKNIVVGPTTKVTVSASYTVTKSASQSAASLFTFPVLYRGAALTLDTPDKDVWGGDEPGTCTTSSSTVLKCTAKIQFRPTDNTDYGDLTNAHAGAWKIGGAAIDMNTGGVTPLSNLGATKVLRKATLTTDAAPEPVEAGTKLTITGKLARANWDTNKNAGYASQSVKLQFKKKGATAYTTVKTIKSGSTGLLKTTVTASADGYYRYVFAGTTTTAPVTSAADFVDAQ